MAGSDKKVKAESEDEMSEISETEIKSMTKEQNYLRGYRDGKSDVFDKIRAIVIEWQADTWTDNFSYECMCKIADIVEESER